MIGNGNVALDVARVLAKHAVDLRPTEIADNVLGGPGVLRRHRRARVRPPRPADIKFTPIELRELGEVPDVDIVVHDEDFADADPAAAPNNQLKVMLRILNSWRTRESTGASRRLHLHFYHAPVEVLGTDRVEGVRFERTEPDGRRRRCAAPASTARSRCSRSTARSATTARRSSTPRSTQRLGVIPNIEGRVTDASARPIPGLFATGWIKRGPVGLIGHTKSDAMETIAHLVADAAAGRARRAGRGRRRARPAGRARGRLHDMGRLAGARRVRARARRGARAHARARQGRAAGRAGGDLAGRALTLS